jgi:hypothetical protein
MTPVYVRQTEERIMFSESCSEVLMLLRRGVNTRTPKSMKIRLRLPTFLIDLYLLKRVLH